MRINWFSPLPPAGTGIACYAVHVLRSLAKTHDVIVWTNQSDVDRELSNLGTVSRFQPGQMPWRRINEADVSIYNIGNHAGFHADILDVCRQSPGIVILHDLCLHDMHFMLWTKARKDRATYLEIMNRWYGRDGRRAAEAFCAGGLDPAEMLKAFPLTRETVDRATGVVVHFDGLKQLKEVPSCATLLLPHPYAAMDDLEYARVLALRRQRRTPPYRLLVFGYLGRNRRLEEILRALAGLGERDRFRLDICGKLWDESHLHNLVRNCGIENLVSFSGFLSDDELHRRLTQTDLALNLRYPSVGEASGSQCRLWDYGIPTLVTETEWYATLPREAVRFVRIDHEIEDIQEHLNAFLAAPGSYTEVGEAGRRSLQNYAPDKYVDELVRFACRARDQASRLAAISLADRTGLEAACWLPPSSTPTLFDRVESELCRAFVRPNHSQ